MSGGISRGDRGGRSRSRCSRFLRLDDRRIPRGRAIDNNATRWVPILLKWRVVAIVGTIAFTLCRSISVLFERIAIAVKWTLLVQLDEGILAGTSGSLLNPLILLDGHVNELLITELVIELGEQMTVSQLSLIDHVAMHDELSALLAQIKSLFLESKAAR